MPISERDYGEFFGTGQLFGTTDPSITPGIKALPGSAYSRHNKDTNTGEMWLKVGPADTDWEQLKLKSEP